MLFRERIHIHLHAGLSRRNMEANARLAFRGLLLAFALGYGAAFAKLFFYASSEPARPSLAASVPIQHALSRPDIRDRNGQLLATDIKVYWLFADPEHVTDPDGAADHLVSVFPQLDRGELLRKLQSKSRFEWIIRGLTPAQAERVHRKGIPGLHLLPERQRVYPAGRAAAHILGITDVDNRGLSGIERYIDGHFTLTGTQVPLGERPTLRLSLDLGVQYALAEELRSAMSLYRAEGAFGLVMDVHSGEVLASVSLPDFDPNHREEAIRKDRQNRILTDSYELGSVFKIFTVAMALEHGIARPLDLIDTGSPLQAGRYRLGGARNTRMTVEDILVRSSNVGTARLALMAGRETQRQFLTSLGLLDPLQTEAGTSARPSEPDLWRPVNVMTISYGHGVAVSPLAFAGAVASIVNGGYRVRPTFLPATSPSRGERVVSERTSRALRHMLRLVVERGTGKRAAVENFPIGGKTGTAQKVKNGRYTNDVLTSFVTVMPIDKPRYLLLVSLDEPKPTAAAARTEAAHNAAPTAGRIVKRIAPMLARQARTQIDEAGPTSY